MRLIHLNDIEMVSTPLGGHARTIANSPDLRLVNLVLAPGEKVLSHEVPIEVIFMILEGKGTLVAGHEQQSVAAGQILFCPPGVSRSLEADSSEALSILVIRAPNPN